MSASHTPPGSPPGSGPGAAIGTGSGAASSNDPSMEDILASIRRILSDDEVAASGTAAPRSPAAAPEDHAASDGVLVLDPAMMVSKPPEAAVPEGSVRARANRHRRSNIAASS